MQAEGGGTDAQRAPEHSSSDKREKCWKLRYRLEDNQLESGVIMGLGQD